MKRGDFMNHEDIGHRPAHLTLEQVRAIVREYIEGCTFEVEPAMETGHGHNVIVIHPEDKT